MTSPDTITLIAAHENACAQAARWGASRCEGARKARQRVREAMLALLRAEVEA